MTVINTSLITLKNHSSQQAASIASNDVTSEEKIYTKNPD